MPHRTENAFDLANALFGLEDGAAPVPKRQKISQLDEQDADAAWEDDDDAAFIDAATASSNRKASNVRGKTVKKGGGFQAMGLNSLLLKAITRKGFAVPTPIQRKTIPMLLDGQDVVGMARTGSGKTAAFVIPMIQKLKSHSAKVGMRAVILSPSRELALQTLKVVKELGRGTDLRTVLLVGGDSLEDQFSSMTSTNPDIVIATPGRFLHLMVEMKLDLSSTQYTVFDEADRLFEMGFAHQLGEILAALPTSRQTLLFSATLPSSLVEFARAGLQEPKLVRLDAESKVSPDLQSAFFTIKSAEKEGALLYVLREIIKMPTGETEAARNLALQKKEQGSQASSKKRKRGRDTAAGSINDNSPSAHSTIIFAATKHHVEYLVVLLRVSGYSVSYIYGSLDQSARKQSVQDFRSGMTNIMVVTDVAARGVDIPVLANVINFDFPSQPKIFVHRVGRTARAGKSGWSYSLIRDADSPYLLDLQLFLGRKLVLGRADVPPNFAEDIVVGSFPRNSLESSCEVVGKLIDEEDDLDALRKVAAKGEKLYNRSRNSASAESAKRSKEMLSSSKWGELHTLFAGEEVEQHGQEKQREEMLKRVSGFRPQETVFEIGKRGKNDETAEAIKARRQRIDMKKQKKALDEATLTCNANTALGEDGDFEEGENITVQDDFSSESAHEDVDGRVEEDEEDEFEVTVSQPGSTKARSAHDENTHQDPEYFMSYLPGDNNLAADRGYGISSGSNEKSSSASFLTAARNASMNLARDESTSFAEPSRLRWDKRSKKYVARANDADGSKGKKMIKGEGGTKIAASLRSGRFDAWRKANNVTRLPRVGEKENASSSVNGMAAALGKRFRHKAEKAPKEADKFRDDYHKRKKRVDEARERRVGKFREGANAKSELRSVHDVRRLRREKERRRDKNARPSRKKRV